MTARIKLARPRPRKRDKLGRRWPRGLQVASDTSVSGNRRSSFGRQEWAWSLRTDGQAWQCLTGSWRLEKGELARVGRKEPQAWYPVYALSDEDRERAAPGREAAAALLAEIVTALGHHPGSRNGRAPQQPAWPPAPPPPTPEPRIPPPRRPADIIANGGPPW